MASSNVNKTLGVLEPALLSGWTFIDKRKLQCLSRSSSALSLPYPFDPYYPSVVCVLLIWTGPQRALVVVSSHRQRGRCSGRRAIRRLFIASEHQVICVEQTAGKFSKIQLNCYINSNLIMALPQTIINSVFNFHKHIWIIVIHFFTSP